HMFHMADGKDLLILDALKRDAKASVVEIAKQTGLPGTTVHNRIKKMGKEGVIKGYTVKVDNKKVGKNLAAYVAITLDYRHLKEEKIPVKDLIKKIAKLPAVEEVDIVTGEIDAIVKVRVKDIEELNEVLMDKLREYPGIDKTQTMMILKSTID
ncbi:MAG: Lrp/AsnC family transcriptional regulator, partial [Candidatus Diapherotrites archaeon]|nr:Lrp/AsnC family transcriptional regulator [Candidatus Diapherotrites archaeon]